MTSQPVLRVKPPPRDLSAMPDHATMRGHNDKLKPYFGPRRETQQRCMNAMEMFHFTHHRVQCPNGAPNYFACRMNIMCQSCMWNRGHFETGYGRSIACKCMYCQHSTKAATSSH